MLAIAEQTAPVTGAVPQARRRVRLRVGKAPSRILGIASDAEGLNELGWIGGLLALREAIAAAR